MPSPVTHDVKGRLRPAHRRPSLLETRKGHDAEDREGPVSILAAIEEPRVRTRARRHKAPVPQRRGRWLLWTLLTVGTVLSLWSAGRFAWGQKEFLHRHELQWGTVRSESSLAAVPAATATQGAPIGQAAAAATAARIEEPVTPVREIFSAAVPVAPGSASSTTLIPDPVVAQARLRNDAVVPMVTRAHKALPVEKPTARRVSTHPRDADVDLMVALFDHMNQSTSKATASRTDTDAGVTLKVKNCKKLGGQEATDCKLRACKGVWGKVDVCPGRTARADD
jgi:hypothetical protein